MIKRLFEYSILFVFIGYIAFCFFIYQNQRSIQYNPIQLKYSPEETGLTDYEFVRVETDDGIALEGWYVPAQNGKKTILFFHGNGQVISTSTAGVSYFIGLGYGVLFVEYRGFSGHAGNVTEDGLYIDALAFSTWLIDERHVPEHKLVFYGESLGTFLALKMAKLYDGAAVVLIAPFSSAVDLAKHFYWYLPADLILKDKLLNNHLIHDVDEPIIIVHGTLDNIVPFKYGQKLYDIAPKGTQFVKIEGANHVNLYARGALSSIQQFMETL